MKTLLALLLVTVGFDAVAQRSSYCKNITADGQRLRIRVDVRNADRSTHYDRSFDVSHLNQAGVQALERHILDSLASATEPEPVVAFASNSHAPFQKTVEENLSEGRLKVRFTFMIDGQENSVERTAIIRDASEAGRRKLREEVERQLTAEMEALMGNDLTGV